MEKQLTIDSFPIKKEPKEINQNDRMKFLTFGIKENCPKLWDYINKQN